VCEEFYGVCNDFLYSSEPKTDCGQATDDDDDDDDDDDGDETISLTPLILWILLIALPCNICLCGLCCLLSKRCRGATAAGPDEFDQQQQNTMYAANTGLDPTITVGTGQHTDEKPGKTVIFELLQCSWEAFASGAGEALFGGDGGGDGGCDGGCGE